MSSKDVNDIVTLMMLSLDDSSLEIPTKETLASPQPSAPPTSDLALENAGHAALELFRRRNTRSAPVASFSKKEQLIMALKGRVLAPGAPFDPEQIPVLTETTPKKGTSSWNVLKPKS